MLISGLARGFLRFFATNCKKSSKRLKCNELVQLELAPGPLKSCNFEIHIGEVMKELLGKKEIPDQQKVLTESVFSGLFSCRLSGAQQRLHSGYQSDQGDARMCQVP